MKRISIGKGRDCPKCGQPMNRFKHPKDWQLKEGQSYYFEWWDVCRKCRHTQHYEQAKRYSDRDKRLAMIRQQLGMDI